MENDNHGFFHLTTVSHCRVKEHDQVLIRGLEISARELRIGTWQEEVSHKIIKSYIVTNSHRVEIMARMREGKI